MSAQLACKVQNLSASIMSVLICLGLRECIQTFSCYAKNYQRTVHTFVFRLAKSGILSFRLLRKKLPQRALTLAKTVTPSLRLCPSTKPRRHLSRLTFHCDDHSQN